MHTAREYEDEAGASYAGSNVFVAPSRLNAIVLTPKCNVCRHGILLSPSQVDIPCEV